MFKKYINCSNASNVFLHLSLLLIMCCSIVLVMYLGIPPANEDLGMVRRTGMLFLESIFAGLSTFTFFYFIMKLLFEKK